MNPEDVIARLDAPLSVRRRIITIVAMLGGLIVAGLVGLLWATEPVLPQRTQVAFAAIMLVGVAWAGYGVWTLSRRTPLFAMEQVIAAWLGVTATALFAAVALVITTLRDRPGDALLGTIGALGVLAVANLIRARRRRGALLRRKRELGG